MVTLAEAKTHVRIFPEQTHFDSEIELAIAAAKDHLSSIDVDMDVEPLPPALHHATLMLVAHFFMNKEAVVVDGSASVVPLGVSRLIAPYRKVSL